MGVYTYTTFKSNLTYELGNRGDVSAYVGNWVNAAYLDLCTRNTFWNLKLPAPLNFTELLKTDSSRATTSGTKYIQMPTDCVSVIHIHDTTNDKPMDWYEQREYLRKTGRDDSDSYGTPTKWTQIGNRFFFYPTPDDAYSLEITYRKRPSLLSADSDVTELDAMWDEAIQKLALVQSLMRQKRYESFAIEKAEWVEMVGGKIGIGNENRRSSRTPFQPDYAYKVGGRV